MRLDTPGLFDDVRLLPEDSPGGRHAAATPEIRPAAADVSGVSSHRPRVTRRDPHLQQEPRRQHRHRAGPPRRRVVTAPRLIAVALVAVIVPWLGGASAQAGGVSSGRLALTPGTSAQAGSGTVLADGTATATFTLPAAPTGGGAYLAVELRAGTPNAYRAKARVLPDRTVLVGISRVSGGVEESLGSVPAGGLPAGGALTVQGKVSGTSPVALAARAFTAGSAVPAWQYSTVDATASAIRTAGAVQVWAYLSKSATSALAAGFSDLSGAPATTTPSSPTTTMASPTSGTPAPTTTKPSASSSSTTRAPSSTTTKAPTSTATSQPAATSAPGGKPGANNTGVPAGTNLTRHDGDLVITKAGSTYSGLDIRGFVKVRAANVTIRKSIVRGGSATGNVGLVTIATPGATNFVIEDSELVPQNPSVWIDDIKGNNFTARRIDAHGGVDAVKIHGDNVLVEDSWLHATRYYSNDPNQGGGATHNDGVQVLGGNNITIRHNTIEGATNGGLQVTQDYAKTTGMTFSDNWVKNGICNVKLSHRKNGAAMSVSLNGNRFMGGTSASNCAILKTSATTIRGSGNVWDSNGQPVPVKVDG